MWSTLPTRSGLGKPASKENRTATIPGGRLNAVSCASQSLCVAVSYEGFVYVSTDPTGGAEAWTPTVINEGHGNTHLTAVSCPSPSFCAAVSGGYKASGKVLTSTDPTSGDWQAAQLGSSLDLRGISCGTPSLCVAVAREGRIFVSTNPTGGASAWKEAGTPGGPRRPGRSRLRIDPALRRRQPDGKRPHLDRSCRRRRQLERGRRRRLGPDHRGLLPHCEPLRGGRQQRRRPHLDRSDGRARRLVLREPRSFPTHRSRRTAAAQRALLGLLRLDLALRPGRHRRSHLHRHRSVLGARPSQR